MSEPAKAVFLSYASQDAGAAQRICEALRAAGVEVWFDQSELRGGDSWDARIRKQIRECALFVPIISANTQARAEGYFRLEWKLAVDRSHLMADDAHFLFPVVIDDTPDATARVPDKFRDVQWTRLNVKDTPETLALRVGKLLGGDVGASLDDARGRRQAMPLRQPPWLRYAWMLVGLLFAVLYAVRPMWQAARHPEPRPAAVAPAPPAAPAALLSEARQLAQRAYAMTVDKYDSTADDYAAADGLVKRALELDPSDGEIWAISSILNRSFQTRGFDRSPARFAAARSQAERAMKLAPDSIEARYAMGFWQRNTDPVAAEQSFKDVLARAPDHAGALFGLSALYNRKGQVEDSLALLQKVSTQPAHAALAGYLEFLTYFSRARFDEADRAVRQSIAVQPSVNSQAGLAMVLLTAQGNADEAARTLTNGQSAMRNEPRTIWTTAQVQLCRRVPDEALKTLDRLADDYIQDSWFTGPKAYFVGRAQALAGRPEAARVAWEAGLALVETRLKAAPENRDLHLIRGELLALLGQGAEALHEARTVTELDRSERQPWFVSPVRIYAALGRADDALPLLEKLCPPKVGDDVGWPLTPALLRLDPLWDRLRDDPRFQKLAASDQPEAAAPGKVDEKSVAVLAFANLSDDKANEYFSDGISEELLNVLAKIPALKVSARTSAFHFKGKDTPIPEIARQLGVAYVVEGTVRKQGDKVRITVQLIKAADGFQVWSDAFTRDLKDIFAVQDEIAGLVAQNLRAKMSLERERAAMAPEVYALVLRARNAAAKKNASGFKDALLLYRAALAQVPGAADVWAELAYAYQYLARFGGIDTGEGMREARLAARQALEIDPNQPLALAAFGWVQRTDDRDWRGAVQSFHRALAVAPENVTIMSDAAICFLNVGLVDEALTLADHAVGRDPLNPQAHWSQGILLAMSGRALPAVAAYQRAIELAPAADEYHAHLAQALTTLGRFAEARAELQQEPNERYRLSALVALLYRSGDTAAADRAMAEMIAQYGDSMKGYIAAVYARAGNRNEAFKWLERAYETRDSAVAWVKTNDFFGSLHDDPRWPVFLHKMGLADDQLK